MAVEVKIPVVYKKLVGGKKILETNPGTIRSILDEILTEYPKLKEKFLDEKGEFKSHLSIFLNNKTISVPEGLDMFADDNDKLIILLAISGG